METVTNAIHASDYASKMSAEDLAAYAQRVGLSSEFEDVNVMSNLRAAASHFRGEDLKAAYTDDQSDTARAMRELIESIPFNELSGDTPLQKAAAGAALVRNQGGLEKMMEDQKSGRKSMHKALEELQESLEAASDLKKNDFASKLMGAGDMPELIIPTLTTDQQQVLKALSVISKMGTLPSLQSASEYVKNREGDEHIYRRIKGPQEARLLPGRKLLDDDFDEKLLLRKYQVPDRYSIQYGKQRIPLFIDHSGSMLSDQKQAYVRAIMLYLFDLVSKGDSVVYIAPFIEKLLQITKIETEDEALEFYKAYKPGRGGTTDIAGVLKDAEEQFARGVFGNYSIDTVKLEKVLVNDGDDFISADTQLQSPLHTLILGVDNENLEQVSKKSAGSYHRIWTSG